MEDIGSGVVGDVAVAAVVVVPVLEGHEGGHRKHNKAGAVGQRATCFSRYLVGLVHQPFHAEGDEDAEGIKTEDVGIVALTGFVGGVVEVEGEDNAAHKEEREDCPEGTTARKEGIDTNKAEEQGEKEVGIVAAGVQTVGRSGTGANKQAVDGRNACDELPILG